MKKSLSMPSTNLESLLLVSTLGAYNPQFFPIVDANVVSKEITKGNMMATI